MRRKVRPINTTDDEATRRESLLDILKDVSPNASNYLMSRLGTGKASNTLHEWSTYNVDRPTSTNYTAEGADFSDEATVNPQRSQNITAITTSPIRVSGTEKAVNLAATNDPMDFYKAKALRILKARMEFNLVNGSAKVSGSSGTAREMAGLVGVISTNVTERASGTSMSTSELEDMLEDVWTNVDDEFVSDVLLVPMGLKQKIATFTTRVTVNQDSKLKIFNNVSMYESSSGTVKIVPHKDVINSAGSVHAIAIREEMYRVGYLREPKWQPISKVGDAERGQYISEYTLESLAERSSAMRIGYHQDG